MANHTFSTESTVTNASGYHSENEYSRQEWRIELDDDLHDEELQVLDMYLYVGERWGDHQYINWSFEDNDKISIDDIQNALASMRVFVDSINKAYGLVQESVEKLLVKKLDKQENSN